MLKLCRITKVKVIFLVLVYIFNFDLFEFSAAILEKGLLNIANRRQVFFSLWPRKRKTKFALTCNVEKVFRALHLKVENLTIHFSQNFWFSLIAGPISFNLIQGFRYLQFKPDALHRLYARHLGRYTVTLR